MASCEVCGNDYDKPMQITLGGTAHTFDSFECSIETGDAIGWTVWGGLVPVLV
jgi:hypothetical protein